MRTYAYLIAALALAACGETSRGSGGIRRIPVTDAGTRDASAIQLDAGPGFDAGPGVDASPFPDAAPHPDAAPRDAGFAPDAAAEDAGVEPLTVRVGELQDPASARHPPLETVVRVSNVVVTAVYSSGQNLGSFWVQEPAGGPFSGIFVYVETPLVGMWNVVPGDRLTITGRYTEYFDLSEIVLTAVESQGPGAPLVPEVRSSADLADNGVLAEAYEGVLVRVNLVAVTSDNPDAPMDFGELEVSGGLRVDDGLYRIEPRPPIGATIDSISGVMNYAFEHRKLLPRDALDVGLIH